MSLISLGHDRYAIIDIEFFDFFNQFKWFATKSHESFYAARNMSMKDGKRRMMYLHHWVIGFPLGDKVVDHIDGNTLNNQRSNLRIVNRRTNQQNRHEAKTKSSKFVGVRWDKNSKKWRSQIKINGKQEHLGLFKDEQDAADAYIGRLVTL